MKIKIGMLPELECSESKLTEKGVEITPVFFSAKGSANVAPIEIVSDGGRSLFKGMIRVSGQTGKPSISTTAPGKPVTAAADAAGSAPAK